MSYFWELVLRECVARCLAMGIHVTLYFRLVNHILCQLCVLRGLRLSYSRRGRLRLKEFVNCCCVGYHYGEGYIPLLQRNPLFTSCLLYLITIHITQCLNLAGILYRLHNQGHNFSFLFNITCLNYENNLLVKYIYIYIYIICVCMFSSTAERQLISAVVQFQMRMY
jgi:hypothetical protein